MKGYIKFFDCLFVAIAVIDFYNALVIYPAIFVPSLSATLPVLRFINAILTITAIAFVILYPILWHKREKKAKANSPLLHAWFTGIIRYWLAAEIFNYGFAKILGTQFAPAYFKGDSTWNSLSGFDLTWNYFSYSYTMSVIIAGIQIVGSAFLLFRRTTILGVILLLPVMVNIVLIDVFYSIATGALMNAVLFTLALTYLLLLQWPAIKEFFIRIRPTLPPIRMGSLLKNLLRLALTAYAFGFIYYVSTTRQPATFVGKWQVDRLVRNGDTAKENDWIRDSLSWKNIYLEEYGRATFSPNPYVVEASRSLTGKYTWLPEKQAIRFIHWRPNGAAPDTFYAAVTTPSASHTFPVASHTFPAATRMEWTITGDQGAVSLQLTKVPEKLHH